MPAGALLADETWRTLPASPLLVVPVGSLEQHGPHLPLDTDARIATAVASATVTALRARSVDALLAPTIALGASGEHAGFPGVLSIGTEALVSVLVETARSARHWVGGVVWLNGHGGNTPALVRAVPQLISEAHRAAWLPVPIRDGDAHAGRTETSLLLHLAPHLVRTDLIEPGVTTPIGELLPLLRAGGVRGVSENGVLGDPVGASADDGRQLFDAAVIEARDRIVTWSADARTGMLRATS